MKKAVLILVIGILLCTGLPSVALSQHGGGGGGGGGTVAAVVVITGAVVVITVEAATTEAAGMAATTVIMAATTGVSITARGAAGGVGAAGRGGAIHTAIRMPILTPIPIPIRTHTHIPIIRLLPLYPLPVRRSRRTGITAGRQTPITRTFLRAPAGGCP